MCAPLYISETAPTSIRGRMMVINQLMIPFGMGGDTEWRLAMGIQCVPDILLLSVMSCMPCSPRWLVLQGRDDEALEIISRLHNETINDQ
jgi:Sugar (and other) transporter